MHEVLEVCNLFWWHDDAVVVEQEYLHMIKGGDLSRDDFHTSVAQVENCTLAFGGCFQDFLQFCTFFSHLGACMRA